MGYCTVINLDGRERQRFEIKMIEANKGQGRKGMYIRREKDGKVFHGRPLEIVRELQEEEGKYGASQEQPMAGIFPYINYVLQEFEEKRRVDKRLTVTLSMVEAVGSVLRGDQEGGAAYILAALQEYGLFVMELHGDV